jgi:hypothetical protein
MEITFKNIERRKVPAFIITMAEALKSYEKGITTKAELMDFYACFFISDNTISSIKFDTNFSTVVTYQNENSLWQMDKYPAVEPIVTFKDLTPKAPCTCCGK